MPTRDARGHAPVYNSRDFTEFSVLANRGTTADYGNYDAEYLNTGPYGH